MNIAPAIAKVAQRRSIIPKIKKPNKSEAIMEP